MKLLKFLKKFKITIYTCLYILHYVYEFQNT
jgi:hypothetical protein